MKIVTGQTDVETIVEPWMPPNACLIVGEKEVVYFRDGKTEIMSREAFDDLMYRAEQLYGKFGTDSKRIASEVAAFARTGQMDTREFEERLRRVIQTEINGT